MIGSLRGRCSSKLPPQLTVEVGGVGYELEAPMSTFFHLPRRGRGSAADAPGGARGRPRPVRLWQRGERRLFRSLIKVSGVGPKIALALLVRHQRRGFLSVRARAGHRRAHARPGIGRKTAERLDRGDARSPGGSDLTPGERHLRLRLLPAPEAEAYDAPRCAWVPSGGGDTRCSKPPVPVHIQPRN